MKNGPDVSEKKMMTTQGYGDPGRHQVNPAVVHTREDQRRQTEGVREAQMAKQNGGDEKANKSLQAIVPRLGQADATHAPDGHERRSPVAIAPTQAGQSSAIPKLEKAEAQVTAEAEKSEEPPKDFMPGFVDEDAKRDDESEEQHKERTKHRRKH